MFVSLVLTLTLLGGMSAVFADEEVPMIFKVHGVAGLHSFKVEVGNLDGTGEYFVDVLDGDTTVAQSDHFTEDGTVEVFFNGDGVLEGEKLYKAGLYLSGGSKSELVYELQFSVAKVVIESVDAAAGEKEFEVTVSGIEESNEFFIEIEDADGNYIGTTEKFLENGAVPTYLGGDTVLEKGATYTAKLFFMTTGSQSEEIGSYEFTVSGSASPVLWIAIAAVVLAVIAIVIVLVAKKNKKKAAQ